MNRAIRFLAGPAIVLLVASLVQAADLHVWQKVTSSGQTMDQEIWMSGKKLKTSSSSPMGKMESIIDLDAKKIYNLMVAQKSYMEMSLDAVKQAAASMQGSVGEIKVEKTGKTQKIGEWNCTEFKVTSTSLDMSVWVTKDVKFDLKEWDQIQKEWQSDPVSKALDLTKIDGFPIKQEGTIKMGGQEIKTSSEVTKIETAAIPASTFGLPADYKKMDMGNPFGGAQPQAK